MSQTGIVFIHGAGLNSSIWDAVIKEIDNPILTVDFPGRKPYDRNNAELSFQDYTNEVSGKIRQWNMQRFIIVAHSIGAVVGLEIAKSFKDNLAGFVAIGSVVPRKGHSFVQTLPFPQSVIMRIVINLFGTKPPDKAIEAGLCNGLTSEQTSKVIREFTTESKKLFTTPVKSALPEIRTVYIKLLQDKDLPGKLQEQMALNLAADVVLQIDSGHLPMISHPQQLSRDLKNFIEDLNRLPSTS